MNARASENYLAISSKSVRYIGDDFFLGPNLVSFNRAVIPLFELSFLTKSQKGGILIFDRGLRYVDVFLHESGFQENRAFFSIFLYSLILPVNKYHLGPGFQVIQHKNIISFTINIALNFPNNRDFVIYLLFTPIYQQYNLYKNICFKKRDRTTMKKSRASYFTFYVKKRRLSCNVRSSVLCT